MVSQKSDNQMSNQGRIMLGVVQCDIKSAVNLPANQYIPLGNAMTQQATLSLASDNERVQLQQAYDSLSQDDKLTGNIAALLLAYGKVCIKSVRKTKKARVKAIDVSELMQLQGQINDDFDTKTRGYSVNMMLINSGTVKDLGMSLQVFKGWLNEDDNHSDLIAFNTRYMKMYLTHVKQSTAFLGACERVGFDLTSYLNNETYAKELHTTPIDDDGKNTLYDMLMRTVNTSVKNERVTLNTHSTPRAVLKKVVRLDDSALEIQEYTLDK